jgi:hypothetical protein
MLNYTGPRVAQYRLHHEPQTIQRNRRDAASSSFQVSGVGTDSNPIVDDLPGHGGSGNQRADLGTTGDGNDATQTIQSAINTASVNGDIV